MFLLFLVGNLVYYVVGILLAVLFKDNRSNFDVNIAFFYIILCGLR